LPGLCWVLVIIGVVPGPRFGRRGSLPVSSVGAVHVDQ
jgi:hypothetical protein